MTGPRIRAAGSIPKYIRARRLILESHLRLAAFDPSLPSVLYRICAEVELTE